MRSNLLQRIAELERANAALERVTGPVMPCGCRAVTMRPIGFDNTRIRCEKHRVHHLITPDVAAWKEAGKGA